MKRYQSAFKVLLCALLSAGVATSALAKGNNIDTGKIQSQLRSVVLPELPVQAATIVKKAKRSAKNQTAAAVVREVIAINPALGVSVVGAIAKAEPKVADVVAVEAATLQPVNLMAITKAATAAAPKQTRQIVLSLTFNFPQEFNKIVSAAILHNPTEENIVNTIGGMDYAIPGLVNLLNNKAMLMDLIEASSAGNTVVTINQNVRISVIDAVIKSALSGMTGTKPSYETLLVQLLTDTDLDLTSTTKTPGQIAEELATKTAPQGTTVAVDQTQTNTNVATVKAKTDSTQLVTVSAVVTTSAENQQVATKIRVPTNYAAFQADFSTTELRSEAVGVVNLDGPVVPAPGTEYGYTIDSWLQVYSLLGTPTGASTSLLVPYVVAP